MYKNQIWYTIATNVGTLGAMVQYNMMYKSYVILAPKMTEKAIMLMEIHVLMSYIWYFNCLGWTSYCLGSKGYKYHIWFS